MKLVVRRQILKVVSITIFNVNVEKIILCFNFHSSIFFVAQKKIERYSISNVHI